MLLGLILSIISGCVIGSFLNLCIDRLSLKYQEALREQKLASEECSSFLKEHLKQQTLTLSSPARSFCFSCGIQLRWYENIPVVSCIINQAQCRTCGSVYGWRTLYVEAATGSVFAGGYLMFLFFALE